MTRQQALKGLEDLFKTGFSYLDVRAYLNKVYDSLEKVQFDVTKNQAIERGNVIKGSPIINTPSSKASNNSGKNNLQPIHDKLHELINQGYHISQINTYSYSLIHQKHGTLVYFPKSNKLQRTKDNSWLNDGFNLINNNLKYFK